ncbi:hypothetical protein [Stenotrophomonas rhizophila]|uniref:hypothetical protein n=1 Tax=Stenotrophomonas rhizophila TaxID=216778 RepID=UPI001E28FDB5|nr:hypothetical protein [Stenotrophomonas rhizophila]MCC7635219.1 hypothetical protein [Stenotrophomonas rhizophila]MCC7664566.1 hypothetical protein [Stenotrophomonas rhizophila]
MPLRRADEILDWLLARQPDNRILEKTTGLPYGWGLWLRALTPLPRPFRAGEVIAVLIGRPLPGPPGRLPSLGAVQALRRLLWQGWEPAPRDQRWMRWSSAGISLLLHVLFAVLLLWVALVRPPAEPEQGGEGERIEVSLVGRGTPQEQGGGEPAAAAAAADTGAAPAPTPTASAPQPASEPTASEPQPAPPSEATPAVEQPVQATEVAQATTDFVVPPTSVARTEVRVVPPQPQDIAVRERSIPLVQAPAPAAVAPAPRPLTPALRSPELVVREREVSVPNAPAPTVPVPGPQVEARLPQRELQVRERQIQPAPAATVAVAAVPQREIVVPGRTRELSVRERSVPNATPRPAPPSPAPATASASASTPNPATAASTAPAAARSPAPAPAARPAADPGNWATPTRGDDWGAANHRQDADLNGRAVAATGNRGGSLFNADGSARVPSQDGKGAGERGAPGGDKDGWTKERIAQSGTWLKRPPYNYTPTSLDKYWAPNESLLAEWVRKGIKAVEIPIPGTNSKISCVVSMLQFGGGCGLTNPNMQDQPAVARPPPDIPFKKELQEDNGSR